MQRKIASLALAGTLGLASLGTGVVLAPGIASAAGETTLVAATGDRLNAIKDALAGLVSDGTLTQAQADKVASTLDRELPRHRRGHHRFMRPALDAAATALGMDKAELRQQLMAGKSLADIAEAEGVSVDRLISKLVAAAEQALADAVADGRLTQAQADERKADLEARITEMVNRSHAPHRRHHRHHGPGGLVERAPEASPDVTSTTA